ncbi:MAG: glycosyltransferase family 4 protein [Candidatus Omnitrophica bacterium]|nr:glycosyltransferase family 4 protein [Candidatus Omnitrophota bacterium]
MLHNTNLRKILFITRESKELPGARIRAYSFAAELRKLGWDADVFSFADHLGAFSGKEEHRLTHKDKLTYNRKAYRHLSKIKNATFIIQRVNYHSFAPLLAYLKDKKNTHIVLDMDDWEIREKIYRIGKLSNSKAEMLTRFIATRAVFCIAASQYIYRFLSRYTKRVLYLPSTVDANVFYPGNGRPLSGPVTFSWIGTMNREDDAKNVIFLIECLIACRQQMEDMVLEIVGDGRYSTMLQYYLNSIQDKNAVRWLQYMPYEQIPEYLRQIDIGLVPLIQKTRFNEAKSPAKLFEYMASGKPIIASSIGEAKQVVQNGKNGILADGQSAFCSAMLILARDAALRRSLGHEASKTIRERFSLSKCINVLHENLSHTF